MLTLAAASAQEQERTLRDRIERPNMDLTAHGFEKTFNPTSSGVNKSFSVHSAGVGRSVNAKGDGIFHTHLFANKDRVQTNNFATKRSSLTEQGAAQAERTFDTKTMMVKEDRAVGKTANNQLFQPSDKPFITHGKRQDEIDELRRQKELSIDQVREILNKNK